MTLVNHDFQDNISQMFINTVDNRVETTLNLADSLNLEYIAEPWEHPTAQADEKKVPKKNKVHDWYQEAIDANDGTVAGLYQR